eukprot:TRINITY_DN1643_c1_g1_i1.p1 TRINITY_DN1643_c1_g1~~TRINITY_DN1643_c1_g1_i1.p1  ORF type:complete len:365 (+),score=121.08 TRINITY_DN1643_c1_g1_i1:83-1177(+)
MLSDLYQPHTIWASDGLYTRIQLPSGTLCVIISAIWRVKERPFLIHMSFTPLNFLKQVQSRRFHRDFFPERIVADRRKEDDGEGVAAFTLSSSVPEIKGSFTYAVDPKVQIYSLLFEDEEMGNVNLSIKLSDKTAHSLLGPMSFGRFLPLPVQWHVFSTRSVALVEMSTEKKEGEGGLNWKEKGYAHIEKNFGIGFPSSWIWIQAFADSDKGSLVVAGGRLVAGVRSFMVALRSPQGRNWDFGPIGTLQLLGWGVGSSMTQMDSEKGVIELTCTDWVRGRRIHIFGKTELDTFIGLTAPLSTGHQKGYCDESFEAVYEVEMLSLGWNGWNVVEKIVMRQGAMEFGGDWSHWWRERKGLQSSKED